MTTPLRFSRCRTISRILPSMSAEIAAASIFNTSAENTVPGKLIVRASRSRGGRRDGGTKFEERFDLHHKLL